MNRIAPLLVALALLALTVAPADAAQPQDLNQGAITNVKQRPVVAAEELHYGQAVSTSTVNAIGPEATNATPALGATLAVAGNYAKQLRIVNLHASQYLCYDTVARAAITDECEDVCSGVGAGALTCTGSGAADGTLITPGASLIVTISGGDCGCIEASAAGTNANVTQVTRQPGI